MGIVNFQQRILQKLALTPTDSLTGTETGAVLDRQKFESMCLALAWGAAGGTPISFTESIILVHGDAANMSDATTLLTLETALDVTVSGFNQYDIDLSKSKRYIQIRLTGTIVPDVGLDPADVEIASVASFFDSHTNPVEISALLNL